MLTETNARRVLRERRTVTEARIITPAEAESWQLPIAQRPLRQNKKMEEIAEELKRSQVIHGTIFLGRVPPDPTIYLVDGQHRRAALKLSGISEAYADVKLQTFDRMEDLASAFVINNSPISKMRPDDVLRGKEQTLPTVAFLRARCPFVGYDNVRRAVNASASPVLSMSVVLRCWAGSATETPTGTHSGTSAANLADKLDFASSLQLVEFLNTAYSAWGRAPEYFRLWGALNLTLCMWLWRKLVVERDRPGGMRYVVLSKEQFERCLMSVSADSHYLDWLVGRVPTERDRSPCYSHLKSIFAGRLLAESNGDKKLSVLPAPEWAKGKMVTRRYEGLK